MKYALIVANLCLALAVVGWANQKNDPQQGWAIYEWSKLVQQQEEAERPYLPFLNVSTLNCGVYSLSKGQLDGQNPHRQDEVYYVVEGEARFKVGGEDLEVKPGSILYVKAGVEHRFHDISQDLKLLVFFSATKE